MYEHNTEHKALELKDEARQRQSHVFPTHCLQPSFTSLLSEECFFLFGKISSDVDFKKDVAAVVISLRFITAQRFHHKSMR